MIKFNYLNAIGRFLTITFVILLYYSIYIESFVLFVFCLGGVTVSCLLDTSEDDKSKRKGK